MPLSLGKIVRDARGRRPRDVWRPSPGISVNGARLLDETGKGSVTPLKGSVRIRRRPCTMHRRWRWPTSTDGRSRTRGREAREAIPGGAPFPHFVFDDFLPADLARRSRSSFPRQRIRAGSAAITPSNARGSNSSGARASRMSRRATRARRALWDGVPRLPGRAHGHQRDSSPIRISPAPAPRSRCRADISRSTRTSIATAGISPARLVTVLLYIGLEWGPPGAATSSSGTVTAPRAGRASRRAESARGARPGDDFWHGRPAPLVPPSAPGVDRVPLRRRGADANAHSAIYRLSMVSRRCSGASTSRQAT